MGQAAFEQIPHHAGVRFTVGRDAGGRWVVSDGQGLVGGLFADRNSAIRFAMFESDHMPGAVLCVPDGQTLSLGTGFENRASGPSLKLVGRV
jgi:hypothetical protein